VNEHDLPMFIKSQSPRGLRLLMMRTNAKYKMTFNYFDIQFVNGYWFAWFYLPAIKEVLDEESKVYNQSN
jgi:hypothetical protein